MRRVLIIVELICENILNMKTKNAVLRRMARESLKGKWGLAIGGFVLFYIISTIISLAANFITPQFPMHVCK